MRFALKRPAPEPPETLTVRVGEKRHAVAVRRSDRAKRLTLRIDASHRHPVLTLPARVPVAEAERFLTRQAGWLDARIAGLPDAVPFVDGGLFPLRGTPTRIVHRPGRGAVRLVAGLAEPSVHVHGRQEHMARRLGDWLKEQARQDLAAAVERHAATLAVKPPAIRIRDTGSRWGSCSSRRTLSFSWRLILAPAHVLDYLAAHEVAHLRQMNHGPAFWELVELINPDFHDAQAWLKREGAGLFAVGRSTAGGDIEKTPAV